MSNYLVMESIYVDFHKWIVGSSKQHRNKATTTHSIFAEVKIYSNVLILCVICTMY